MPRLLDKLDWIFSVGADLSAASPVFHLAAREPGSEILIPSGGPYPTELAALGDMVSQEARALLEASRAWPGPEFAIVYERRLIDPGAPGAGWIWRLDSQVLCPLRIHARGASSFVSGPAAAPEPCWP